MPRTANPTWTRDDLLLARDVYMRHPTAGKTHEAVLELSDGVTLKTFPPLAVLTQSCRSASFFDWWTSKGRDIRAGDRAIIWKYQGCDSVRGVVALAEVLTDAAMVKGSRDASASELDPSYPPAERIRIRYVLCPNLPLWVGGLADRAVGGGSSGRRRLGDRGG